MTGAILTPGEAATAMVAALEAGSRVVSFLRLDHDPPLRRLLVFPPGAREGGSRTADTRRPPDSRRTLGSLGDEALDRAADRAADRLAPAATPGRMDVLGADLYVEVHEPQPPLVIVGAGHIAQPLSEVAALLGFRVTVADDRPDFATRERFPRAHRVERVDFSDPFRTIPVTDMTHVVLVTRGHKYDYDCLLRLLRGDPLPRYLGMIGSRRRVRATFTQLLAEGVPRERIQAVRAPIGLDVGAETPAEIAVAVAAEMILEWRGGTGAALHGKERVLERYFPPGDEAGEGRADGSGDEPGGGPADGRGEGQADGSGTHTTGGGNA